MIEPRFREMGVALAEQWNQHARTRGKWYKLMVEDPTTGQLRMFICSAGKSMLTAMVVCSHNMSKTAINSKPGNTTLQLKLDAEGEVYSANLAPATAKQIEVYTKCWSNLKSLLT